MAEQDEKLPEPTPTEPAALNVSASGDVNVGGSIAGRDIIITHYHGPAPAPQAAPDEAPAEGSPPYKGLACFDEQDADNFFGREALTAQLVERLQTERCLIIVGASGSGKSSVARAGLVPALRRVAGNLLAPVILPGSAPLNALAASLLSLYDSNLTETDKLIEARKLSTALRHGELTLADVAERVRRTESTFARLWLVADQFEETFTLCPDGAERKAFIECLMQPAGESVGIVITLRADFYAFCEPYPALRAALENHQAYIGPMTPAELRQAIERPAERGGWRLEEGLVETLLKDVGDEPGALPLLSHALFETWNNRRGHTLTLRGYAQAGGVRGAIAKTADRAYAALSPEEQLLARRIFLELTQLGEGTQDTRRRVPLRDLFTRPEDEARVRDVLARLAHPLSRLVVTEQESVEVAHEALIREWQALRGWLDENRERLRQRRNLLHDAKGWDEAGRDPSYLYTGARLAAAREQLTDPEPLPTVGREFVQASLAAQEAAEREKEAARRRELETERQYSARVRLRSRVIAVVGVLALVAAGVAIFFAVQAQERAQESLARSLAAQAGRVFDTLPNQLPRAALLAGESLRREPNANAEASDVLNQALDLLPPEVARVTHDSVVTTVAFSPDGRHILTASGRKASVLWWQAEDLINLACSRLTRNLTQEEWKQYLGDEPYRKTCPDLP